MSRSFARTRLVTAVVTAFIGGLAFASAFDLTRWAGAQQAGRPAPKPSAQEIKPLVDAGNAFVSIAEHVTPAVVSIRTERDRQAGRNRGRAPSPMDEFLRQFGDPNLEEPQESSGSGFVVSKDGYILTNNHVVAGADRIEVRFIDGRVFQAKVTGRDSTTDVAVIKIEGSNLPTVALGDDSSIKIGEWVLAVGNPLGLDFTVTAGIVSAKGRRVDGLLRNQYAISDFIQTDAAINPGNSGGPLVNIRGEVVGINSAIASRTGFYSGYGFAIPITLARDVMNDLIAFGRVKRAVLGISINEVDATDAQAAGLQTIAGVKVSGFNPPDGSPAERAGMEPGDIIVAIDGRPVDRVAALQRVVRSRRPGETVTLDVVRFGQRKQFKVRLMEVPTDEQTVAERNDDDRPSEEGVSYDKLGISVQPIPQELARQANLSSEQRGVLVSDVLRAGPAHNRLTENRDVILEVIHPAPRRPIRTPADLDGVLSKMRSGDFISLRICQLVRDGCQEGVVNLRVGG
ncbi:MAG TPA: Do family serine endopeptidase [Gemmatimonadaceae bacterium]|nr:Do family serine endopeptidase [Gemmatimonadaceae bacterium]